MRPHKTDVSLYRTALGGGIGFLLGTVAILSFGVMGLAAPFIGLLIGTAVGAFLSRREAVAFLLGYLVTGIAAFLIALFVLQRQLDTQAGTPTSVSFAPVSGMIANGCALIGGVIASALAGQFAPPDRRSPSGRTILIAIPVMLLGVAVFGFGAMIAEEWVGFEIGHAANRQQNIEAEKLRSAPPTDTGLPVQSGPFLYPNRLSLRGDSRQITMTTRDEPETVVGYYTRTLNARFYPKQDASFPAPFAEGDFLYQGKSLHIRIASQNYQSSSPFVSGVTDIVLNAP